MRKHCKSNERQAIRASQPNQTVTPSYEQGKYFVISLSFYSFVPMCCLEVVCIFIPFHVQETKGQVAQHSKRRLHLSSPLLLHVVRVGGWGGGSLLLVFIWGVLLVVVGFFYLTANFHCILPLASIVVIQQAQQRMYQSKEAIPSPGSLQCKLPVLRAVLRRPHEPTKTSKMSWQHRTVLNNIGSDWRSISWCTQQKPKVDSSERVRNTNEVEWNHHVMLSCPYSSIWTTSSSSIQGVAKVVLNATQLINMNWPSQPRVAFQAFLPLSLFPTHPWLLFSTLWALGSQSPCHKSQLLPRATPDLIQSFLVP